MARAVLIIILGLGCSLAAASPSLRGQERRLDQAQVPAEESFNATGAAPAWEGMYADPVHVGCKREIKANGLSLTISGTTGTPGPGCGAGDTETSWVIPATIKSQESPDIVIDFSPKGGPKDLNAEWDGDGIKFADGNKWVKLSANATGAAGAVPTNVSARVVVGAAAPVCAENGEICWRAADCCSARCALTESLGDTGMGNVVVGWKSMVASQIM